MIPLELIIIHKCSIKQKHLDLTERYFIKQDLKERLKYSSFPTSCSCGNISLTSPISLYDFQLIVYSMFLYISPWYGIMFHSS